MNKMLRSISAAFSVVVALTLLGCAGTRYEQSTGEYIDSKAINAKVKAALLDDPAVKGTDVNVDVWKEIVTLNGFVDTAEQKSRAEQIAQGVDGVRSVQNNLVVKTRVAPETNTEAVGAPSNRDTTTGASASASGRVGDNGVSASTRVSTDNDRTSTLDRNTTTTGTGSTAGSVLPLDILAGNADKFYGRTVTVTGQVGNRLNQQAFTLRVAGNNPNQSIVVAGQGLPNVQPGDRVEVTGTVREFNPSQIRQEVSGNWDEETVSDYKGRPSIVARTVDLIR